MNLPWRRRAQRRHKALDGRRRPVPVTDVAAHRFEDIRAQWLEAARVAKSAVYFVDGEQVGSWSDVRAALGDGNTHSISYVAGEAGPEMPFGGFDS